MEINQNIKNQKLNRDLTQTEKLEIKNNLFYLFYHINKKKDMNILICCFYIFIETFQIISFAFSEPVYIKKNIKKFLNIIF